MHQRRRSAAAVLASIAVLAAVPAGISASASPSTLQTASTSSDALEEQGFSTDYLARNDELGVVVERLRTLNSGVGYGAVVTDQGAGTIGLVWRTPVPEAVRAVHKTVIDGFTIDVRESKYSEEDLLRAGDELRTLGVQSGALPINRITMAEDLSGLIVSVTPETLLKAATKDVAELRPTFQELTRTPITSVKVQAASSPRAGRQDDADPWSAGGMTKLSSWTPTIPGIRICTIGFSVVTPGGAGRMLGARHCASSADTAFRNGAMTPMSAGGTQTTLGPDDSLLIDPLGGTAPYTFRGTFPSTSRLKIAGYSRPFNGDILCTSGANSGEHCNMEVVSVALENEACPPAPNQAAGTNCHVWHAVSATGGVGSVQGDSGGPVYKDRADAGAPTLAKGIIMSGTDNGPCGQVRYNVGTACGDDVFLTDIYRLLTYWELDIDIAP